MAGIENAPVPHDDVEQAERQEAEGKGAKKKMVRVVVTKGRTVIHGAKTHGENAELALPLEEATQLIGAGFVRQIGAEDDGRKPIPLPKAGSDTSK